MSLRDQRAGREILYAKKLWLKYRDQAAEVRFQKSDCERRGGVELASLGVVGVVGAGAAGQWPAVLTVIIILATWLLFYPRKNATLVRAVVFLCSFFPSACLFPLLVYSIYCEFHSGTLLKPRWSDLILDLVVRLSVTAGMEEWDWRVIWGGVALAVVGFVEEHERRKTWECLEDVTHSYQQLHSTLSRSFIGLTVLDIHCRPLYATPSADRFLSQSWLSPTTQTLPLLVLEAIKGKERELFVKTKSQAYVVRTAHVSWGSANCCLLTTAPADLCISLSSTVSSCSDLISAEISTLERDIAQEYRNRETDLEFQALNCIHRAKTHLFTQKIYLQSLTNTYISPVSAFNIRTELLNVVELGANEGAEKGTMITLVFEPGVPRTVEGDREGCVVIATFMYKIAMEAVAANGHLVISAVISGVSSAMLTLTFHFDFSADQATAQRLSNLFSHISSNDPPASCPPYTAVFSDLLRLSGNLCHCSSVHKPGNELETVSIWCQYHAKMGTKDVTFAANLPSKVRAMRSSDKFQWDYRTYVGKWECDREDKERRLAKRNSFRHLRRVSKRTGDNPFPLATVKELSSQDVVLSLSDMPSPPLPSDNTEHLPADPPSLEVTRHACDISSISGNSSNRHKSSPRTATLLHGRNSFDSS